jgi:NAD(P)-dependent dehydrogenase (short-subunit alcohol dehydrogenase family)
LHFYFYIKDNLLGFHFILQAKRGKMFHKNHLHGDKKAEGYILITGVSTGIGYAATVDLAQRGYHLFGSVRNQADAERLRQEIPANFTPLVFDVTDRTGVETAVTNLAQILTAQGQGLTALINNAGISTPGPLQHMPLDDFRYQFEVNLFGLLYVTQQCLPLLGARPNSAHPPGRIINISSVSGQIAYPFMGAYAASKHALEAMSDSLRREIMGYGVDVILIEPGTVQTPIVGKFAEQIAQYADTDYGPILQKVVQKAAEREDKALPITAVTHVIRTALESKRPRTRYPIPRRWLSGWLLPRWLPDRWFDWLVARELRK